MPKWFDESNSTMIERQKSSPHLDRGQLCEITQCLHHQTNIVLYRIKQLSVVKFCQKDLNLLKLPPALVVYDVSVCGDRSIVIFEK